MKKSMLWTALFAVASFQIQAQVIEANPPSPVNVTPPATSSPSPVVLPAAPAPLPSEATQPSTIQQHVKSPPYSEYETQQPQPQATQLVADSTPVIDCNYKVPADLKTFDQSLIQTWAKNAALQAFNFDPIAVDSQMQKLQNCFTEQGWLGFNAALQKSGNVTAIKTQKLTVSSIIDGNPQLTETKENQWQVTLPVQVIYQNDKEKVSQLLTIDLIVGRKISGDLGIMQMVAKPRVSTAAPTINTPQPSSTAPSSTAAPNPVPAAPAAASPLTQ